MPTEKGSAGKPAPRGAVPWGAMAVPALVLLCLPQPQWLRAVGAPTSLCRSVPAELRRVPVLQWVLGRCIPEERIFPGTPRPRCLQHRAAMA